MQNLKAIAFDIDGTLYPAFSLYWRMSFYVLRNLRFYLHFRKVRKVMHRTAPLPDFYEYQGRLLATELGCTVEEAKEKIDRIMYRGITKFFTRIKTFKGVEECFRKFKEAGYKIAVLSDFPPSQKGEFWGLKKYCDFIVGSEELGALKPSKYPFGIVARNLGVKEEEILYVGNSIKYDVVGANRAGMKSAIILTGLRKLFRRKVKQADISFVNYRQLTEIVLNS